jgi:hypothetical protein
MDAKLDIRTPKMNAEIYTYGNGKLVEGCHQALGGVRNERSIQWHLSVPAIVLLSGPNVGTAKPHHFERGQDKRATRYYDDEQLFLVSGIRSCVHVGDVIDSCLAVVERQPHPYQGDNTAGVRSE